MDAPPCPIVLSPVFAEQDLHRVGQPVFSADGTRVAYGWRDGTVFVVDAFTGKCEFVIEGRVAGDVVRQIMFSADGRRLAVARAKDGVSVYDGDRGGECAVLKKSRDHLAASMAFLDDDAGLLVVDEGGGLLVWDGEAEDHGWIVSDVHRNLSAVLSRNGRRLAMWVKGQTVIRYLDSERETTVRVLNVEAAIQQVVFSENGRTLVIRTRGRYCWIFDFERDSADGVMCDALDLITSVGVSSDGSVALMGVRSGYCVRYRVDGGRDVLPAISPAAVTSIDVSADGRWAAVASEGGSICVWDLAAVGKPFLLRGHTKSVFSVRFSPDGRLMASGSYDCSIRIWRWSASDRLAQLRANTSDTLTPQERVKYLLEDPEEALVAWRVGEREKGRSGT